MERLPQGGAKGGDWGQWTSTRGLGRFLSPFSVSVINQGGVQIPNLLLLESLHFVRKLNEETFSGPARP